jgi:signal transduction histidine kinase
MIKNRTFRLKLAYKFYLLLVVPLIAVSSLVTWVTYQSLNSNAADLAKALTIQGKANRLLPLLLVQDDSSKAILIDPEQLGFFSTKKIAAYDEHKTLIAELKAESKTNPKYNEMLSRLNFLSNLDETKLRAIDSFILEQLFENPAKARALYFTDYEPHRLEYEKGIRELTQIGNDLAAAASVEMTQKNTASLLQVSLALVLGIIVIATAITILSKQVERSENNTKSLLAVLNEGLFFFDKQGFIASERSEPLARIIPGSESVTNLFEFVKTYSSTTEANVKSCLELLWAEDDSAFISDFDSTITFLPRTLVINQSQTIELDYRPLRNHKNQLEKVVVVAVDATERLKNETEAVIQAERVRKISRVAASIDSYQSFLEEAINLFKRADHAILGSSKGDLLPQIKRDLHTLKGSIGTFEFTSLAGEIHHAESIIEDYGLSDPKFHLQWDRIKDQWRFETNDIETVLRLEGHKEKIQVVKSKLLALAQYAQGKNDNTLKLLVTQCEQIPCREAFAKYEAYIEKLCKSNSDKQVKLVFAQDCADVTFEEIQRIDGALVHMIRNSIDHGIEDQAKRSNVNKPPIGSIHVGCYRRDSGGLHIVLKDDGQGINGDLLAFKSIKIGRWTEQQCKASTYQEKIELIFVPNLSTKEAVTETSGRGVGMDAVKSLITDLGGSITVYSQLGIGSQFELDIPPLSHGIQTPSSHTSAAA